jgi:predicted dehydrogenase
MLDTSSHSVDLFRFLLGEVAEQSALMSRHFEGTDVEDAAILLLKSTRGALGSLSSAFVAGDGSAYIDVTGQDGRLLYDYFQPDVLKYKKREGEWQNLPVQPSDGFSEQIAAFCQCIQNDTLPPVPAEEGLRCLEVLFAAYESRSAS